MSNSVSEQQALYRSLEQAQQQVAELQADLTNEHERHKLCMQSRADLNYKYESTLNAVRSHFETIQRLREESNEREIRYRRLLLTVGEQNDAIKVLEQERDNQREMIENLAAQQEQMAKEAREREARISWLESTRGQQAVMIRRLEDERGQDQAVIGRLTGLNHRYMEEANRATREVSALKAQRWPEDQIAQDRPPTWATTVAAAQDAHENPALTAQRTTAEDFAHSRAILHTEIGKLREQLREACDSLEMYRKMNAESTQMLNSGNAQYEALFKEHERQAHEIGRQRKRIKQLLEQVDSLQRTRHIIEDQSAHYARASVRAEIALGQQGQYYAEETKKLRAELRAVRDALELEEHRHQDSRQELAVMTRERDKHASTSEYRYALITQLRQDSQQQIEDMQRQGARILMLMGENTELRQKLAQTQRALLDAHETLYGEPVQNG